MSYDLFFVKPGFTYKQFTSYFSDRSNFTLSGKEAEYFNEDTGVAFVFYYPDTEPDETDDEKIETCAAFNINYNRPHYFALEAEPEVRRFVEHFELEIHDPQIDGIKGGKYDSKDFVRGWNAGNKFAFKVFEKQLDEGAISLTPFFKRPTEELDKIWKWNYARNDYQNKLGDNIFVPKITFNVLDQKLYSVAVWSDAIPTLIPQVDLIAIMKMSLASRPPLRRRKYLSRRKPPKKKDELYFSTLGEVKPLIEQYETHDYALPAYRLNYTSPPAAIIKFVKSCKPFTGEGYFVDIYDVLNEELFSK